MSEKPTVVSELTPLSEKDVAGLGDPSKQTLTEGNVFSGVKTITHVSCQLCFYYRAELSSCQRHPPTVLLTNPGKKNPKTQDDMSQIKWACVWPHVRPTDWCGDWVAKKMT